MSAQEQADDATTPSLVMGIVVRRYFVESRNKSEIAEELGISRFRVARLLEQAVASGVVKITVQPPAEVDLGLGRALADRYGLSNAVVVNSGSTSEADAKRALAVVGARYLQDVLSSGEVLGLSWGSSVAATVDRIAALPPVEVVQLAGAVRTDGREVSGAEIVRRLAVKSGSESYPLHVPLLLRNPRLASALRQEPGVRRTLQAYRRLTTALVGIGAWTRGQSALHREFNRRESDALEDAGAVADVCGHVLGADGSPLDDERGQRLLGITWQALLATPRVIGIAGGLAKEAAIAAVLRGTLLNTLITDAAVARRLLS